MSPEQVRAKGLDARTDLFSFDGNSFQEIQAIKDMTLFRGMSKDAVDYSIGFSESGNDWGRGGKQRIYFGGKLLVYLDNSGKVQDWQNLN